MKTYSNRSSYITLVIGFSLSAILAWSVAELRDDAVRVQIKAEMKELSYQISRELFINFEALYIVKGLFDSGYPVKAQAFERLASETLSRHNHILSLQWAPLVSAAQREQFEQQVQSEFKGYQLREPSRNSNKIPARNRKVHFPVLYREPASRSFLGLDLAGHPIQIEAIRRAVQRGGLEVSDPLSLRGQSLNLQSDRRDFLAVLPVFGGDTDTRSLRVENLKGVVVGEFSIHTIMRDVIASSRIAGLHVTLFDLNTQQSRGFESSVLFSQQPVTSAVPDMQQRFGINNLGGHNWQLVVAPSEGFMHERKGQLAYIVMLMGMMITGGLAAYIRMVSRREVDQSVAIKEKSHEISLSHKRLDHLSQTDGLTGISNRHFFDISFDQEWKRTRREHQPMALIMFDMDCFKHYNELNGRLQGDECLRNIAELVKSTVHRPGDLFARFDGQTFALLLPNTPSAGALMMGEQCRQLVESISIPHNRSSVSDKVTISVGVCSLIPDDSMDKEQLLDLTDQALVLAKDRGRNQVVDAMEESLKPRPPRKRVVDIND